MIIKFYLIIKMVINMIKAITMNMIIIVINMMMMIMVTKMIMSMLKVFHQDSLQHDDDHDDHSDDHGDQYDVEGVPPRLSGKERVGRLRFLSHSHFSRFATFIVIDY